VAEMISQIRKYDPYPCILGIPVMPALFATCKVRVCVCVCVCVCAVVRALSPSPTADIMGPILRGS